MGNQLSRVVFFFVFISCLSSLHSQQTVHSTITGGNWDIQSTWVEGVVPGASDSVVLQGPVSMVLNHSCSGLTILQDGSLTGVAGNRYLTITGNVDNNGAIGNGGALLFLTIHGNIRNAGNWDCWSVNLTGSNVQQIDSEGTSGFECNTFYSSKMGGHLVSQLGMNFSGTNVDLDGRELILLKGRKVNINGNYLRDAVINGDSSILEMSGGAYLQDVTADSLILKGNVRIGNNAVYFNGFLVVEDTLENYGSTHFTNIQGTIVNNGCIRNGSSYLNLYIQGDIVQNGVWDNYSTTLTGTGTREISMASGREMRTAYFTVDGPGKVMARGDLRFVNSRFNFNYDTLSLQEGGSLAVSFTGGSNRFFRNIVVDGNNGYLETHNGVYLENADLYDIKLRGIIQVGNNNCHFRNSVTVLDTLQNYGTSAHNCYIDGNITNNGVIRDETGLLNIFVSGGIINNFIWSNYTTTLCGTTDQDIRFAPGATFTGYELFVTGTKQVTAGSSLSFDNTRIDFNYNTLVLGQKWRCTVSGSSAYLRQITIAGDGGMLSMHGGAYIQDAVVENTDLGGRIMIYGNNILLRGAVVNYDTIQNMGIDHSLIIEGAFTNLGYMINGNNNLITEIRNNAVNEGCWDNMEIKMNGSTDQYLLFRSDSIVRSPVRLQSGLYGSPFQWYKNGFPLPGEGSPDLLIEEVGQDDFGVYHCISQTGTSADFHLNAAVNAMFSVSDSSGCLPFTVEFSDGSFSPGQISSWLWDFGDGETSTESNPVHTYNTKGEYAVSLKVCDGTTCDSVRCDTLVKVGYTPLADFSFQNAIPGEPVHFVDLTTGADSLVVYEQQWGDTVLGFSSRYTPPPPNPEWWWSEEQILGEPDVYPVYGDYTEAWAPLTACGQREYIVVGFAEPRKANRIMIYETLHPGAIDTVYVISSLGYMLEVWSGTAEPLPLEAREFVVDFEITPFEVAAVRIAMNTEAVPYWNELDAVALCGPVDTIFSSDIHYLWETGENGITYTTTGDIVHTYSSEGTYTASLTLDYRNNCFSRQEKTVTIFDPSATGLDFRFFLEGPFDTESMLPNLTEVLPLSQPYSGSPWNYWGAEEVAGIPSGNIVDWALIDLRRSSGPPSSAIPDSSICKIAAFVDTEGNLTGSDGATPPRVLLTQESNIYAVIMHRNHLPVISSVHIQKAGNDFIYDFSNDPLKVFGGENACRQVAAGIWALTGADGNGDGQINNGDKNDVWIPSAGLQGYRQADFNLDGQVNNGDKNDVWIPNTGMGGQVPD